MKFISLEKVNQYLDIVLPSDSVVGIEIKNQINSLPTIDPVEIIKETVKNGDTYFYNNTMYVDADEIIQKFNPSSHV